MLASLMDKSRLILASLRLVQVSPNHDNREVSFFLHLYGRERGQGKWRNNWSPLAIEFKWRIYYRSCFSLYVGQHLSGLQKI